MMVINIIKNLIRNLGFPIQVINAIYIVIIRHIDGEIGEKARYRYYKSRFYTIGSKVKIDTGVYFYGCKYISIGSGTHIDKNCIIVGSSSDIDLSMRVVKKRNIDFSGINRGEIIIGRDCHISQNCMIFGYGGVYVGNNCVMSTGAKLYSLTSMAYNPVKPEDIISIMPYTGISPTLLGKIVLQDNTWIGINVVVSPGVLIGKNSFIRSNSIVLSSFNENSYIAGDPAIRIRARFLRKDE